MSVQKSLMSIKMDCICNRVILFFIKTILVALVIVVAAGITTNMIVSLEE